MDWLFFELAGRPPRKSFDHWLELKKSPDETPIEWFKRISSEKLKVSPIEKEKIIYHLSHYPEKGKWLSVDGLVKMAANLCWRCECYEKVMQIGSNDPKVVLAEREKLLTRTMSSWRFTATESKLFRILDGIQESALPNAPDPDGGALSYRYIAGKLWQVDLNRLPVQTRRKREKQLCRLRKTINQKLCDARRNDLRITNPCPQTMALRWTEPGPKPATMGFEDCMSRLRELLSEGRQPARETEAILRQEGFSAHMIRKSREGLGIDSIPVGNGASRVWWWKLPSRN
jgi:hypothetical protein